MTSVDPRAVPRTDATIADPLLAVARATYTPAVVRAAVRAAQERVRAGELDPARTVDAAAATLRHASAIRPVINATGVVLHTNLGRAPLAPAAIAAVIDAAGYCTVEFDQATGSRGRRGAGALAALAGAVPTAPAAHIVNNGAAALVLAATVLAQGRELIVSRGELVEIGDGFRLPDLLRSTGARLREVGTTNRSNRRDYADAIGPETGAILRVHPSNFTVEGFTSAVPTSELSGLGVPVIADIGSGLLVPEPLLPREPDATTALRDGAGLVTFSGDKLLGGPQAGLLLGTADLIERCRRHPLARALRADKLTLAALEATIRLAANPTRTALHADLERLRTRTVSLAHSLGSGEVVDSTATVGGGGAPGVGLPSVALALPGPTAALLRAGDPVVVARIERGRCLVDLRAVAETQDVELAAALARALRSIEG